MNGNPKTNKIRLVLFCAVALPLIVVAGVLAMPLHGIFWVLGVSDQFMDVCHAAGGRLRYGVIIELVTR